MMPLITTRIVCLYSLFCLLSVRPATAQFGSGGMFGDLLNQALPRIAPSNNQQGYPGSYTNAPMNGQNNYPSTVPMNNSGFNTGMVPGQISGRPRDWTLGVALDNLDTGAIVRQVSTGSPAQRANIEQGDVIVAIGGAQVGMVDGRLNDVGEQIRRSANTNGYVRALVLDARTNRLQNVEINLDSASTGIAGTAITRDRANLSYGSILRVKLENVTRPFYEVSGGETEIQVYGSGPYNFELNYDPRFIDPRDQYRLNASITNASRQPLYALRQPIAVPSSGMPSNIRLDLESMRDLQMSGGGGVIQASYPADPSLLNQVFQQLLGRMPSAKEEVAWSSYLAQGNSIDDLKAKIIGSPNYYDRMGNNPSLFVQSMIQIIKGEPATSQEIAAWTNRLQQYQGQREALVREFIQQVQR
ncbi:MAG: YbaY family lipoprotein [Pirellulaceae bacterium]|nr:YbaY family lipoprotein [Pirellulaceae bacterium]